MPIVNNNLIYKIALGLFSKMGAPKENATTLAQHLTDANLAGHDSHGIIRTMQYIKEIDEGTLNPRAQPEIVQEAGGSALVNGNSGFGQIVATFATQLAISKAKKSGISFVSMGRMGHTGRIGAYPETVAQSGMAAIMFTGFMGGPFAQNVTPFGGSERRYGTNPISMSFPLPEGGRVLLDFATSMAAEGNLRVYRAGERTLPDKWIIDKNGMPSDNPNDYYDGGAILPMGGMSGGHKGYALGFMVALFGGLLGGLGATEASQFQWSGSSSIIVIDVASVSPIPGVSDAVQEAVEWVKSSSPMEGSQGVLYPGEIEKKTREERLSNGIPVEQTTWNQLMALVQEHGLEKELSEMLQT